MIQRAGWKYESVRHSLAARGIRSGPSPRNYFSRKYLADAVAPQMTEAEKVKKENESLKKRNEKQEKKLAEQRGAQRQQKELTAQLAVEKLQEQKLVRERPIAKIQDAIASGSNTVVLDGVNVPIGQAIGQLSGNELASATAAVNERALKLSNAGVAVSKELESYLSDLTKQQIKANARERAKALESPFKREAKELAQGAAFGVIGAGELATRGTVEAVGTGLVASQKGVGTAKEGGHAFQEANVFLGENEGKGIGNPLKGLEGTESLSASFDDLLGVKSQKSGGVVKGKSEDKIVQQEVQELYDARGQMAQVDLSPYYDGESAFKQGDREKLIHSINDLEAQEQLMADRFSLVEQTRAQVLNPKHRALAYLEEGSTWSIFGGSGGKKLAERTEKVAEVKRRIKDSANQLYGRRKLLRYKLQRMDATVEPERSIPQRKVKILDGSESVFSTRDVLQTTFGTKEV